MGLRMSLTTALSSTITGLQVAQSGISVTSRNIANVNTPGYGRGEVFQEASRSGVGVEIAKVRRAADRFLAKASYEAAARSGAAAVRADALGRSQVALGDPNSGVSVFSRVDQVFAELQSLAINPASPSQRQQALAAIDVALGSIEQANQDVLAVRRDVELAIPDTVNEINGLLRQIADANAAVVQARASGPDAVTAENSRSQLFDQLAELVDIQVNETAGGFAEVRTNAGALLTGVNPSRIEVGTGPAGEPTLSLVSSEGQSIRLEPLLQSGRLTSLMNLATEELPAIGQGLATLASSFATAINRATNASTAVPAPNVLQGADIGAPGTDALGGAGSLTIARVGADNAISSVLTIDLTSVATIDDLVTAINSDPANTPNAVTATFANGRLSLSGAGGGGVVVGGSATRNGVGFSQAFGLNDLIVGPADLQAAVLAGQPLGLTVRADIAANADRLPLARPDLTVGSVLERGDTRGALALAAAGEAIISVPATGLLPAQSGTVGDIAARVAAEIGRRSGVAEADQEFAQQLRIAADERRTGVEGVNLDGELVRLTQYQLAYQASARVVQAIDELFDTLLNSIR